MTVSAESGNFVAGCKDEMHYIKDILQKNV